MRYQAELERLTTLDADAISRACSSREAVMELIEVAIDECIEYDELADEHLATGDHEDAAYCRQEAAAWRATTAVLQTLGAATFRPRRRSAGAA
ncbi:hypothetical protein [Gordonia hankookensis]|uniref:TY-Chap C-terminal domain-containing protein n=1 Tax=Gordonia hankookensis TaxID=589403 RepID=A0ABR7W7Z1_9ACTN|nr:hypothetical protein [Gordonia hankookensis]MBD1318934.1 hypothetical protein [Gordonia hankookensis]